MQTQLDEGTLPMRRAPRPPRNEREAERTRQKVEQWTAVFRRRVRRAIADVDYLAAAPMGWREGTVLVWAGMRGVVTLAAAQTLPEDTPQRSLLILIAFVVAAGTLVAQGGTLPYVVSRLGLAGEPSEGGEPGPILNELFASAGAALDDPSLRRPDGTPYDANVIDQVRRRISPTAESEESAETKALQVQYRELRLVIITAMREELLRVRSEGTYDSASLESALLIIDADQITTELQAGWLGEQR
jgi:CPA1 family monovalent cation:H+ antiporter